jgi:hypothetical protein
LVGLRHHVGPDVAFESQLLPMVNRGSPVGEYRRAIACPDFDSVVASVNSGLKIEFRGSQEDGEAAILDPHIP